MADDDVGDGSVARSSSLVHEDGITARDAVRRLAETHGYDLSLSDQDIDFLLEERTAFPVAGWDLVSSQLLEAFEEGWPLSEDVTITIEANTVDLLATCFGTGWASRFLDNDHRHNAVIELTERLHPKISGAEGADRHLSLGTGTWPLAIDSHDWTRPPGRYLKSWSESVGASDADMAAALTLPVDEYLAVVSGTERITPELAQRIEIATDTFPANFWLRLERSYRAALIELAEQPHR